MNLNRYLLTIALIPQLSLAMIDNRNSVFIPNTIKSSVLARHNNDFHVIENGEVHVVQKAFTDPMIRKMNDKQFQEFLKVGYLTVNKMSDNQYSLKAKVRGNGGGAGGATVGVIIGASAVQAAYHGFSGALAAGVGFISGPAAPATVPAVMGVWYFWTAAPAAVLTKTVAIGCGIALGVATGPA